MAAQNQHLYRLIIADDGYNVKAIANDLWDSQGNIQIPVDKTVDPVTMFMEYVNARGFWVELAK